jgi:hypothetical protein
VGKRGALFAKMYQKRKELAVKSANPVKVYVIEIKIVSLSPGWPGSGKKRGKNLG